MSEEQEAIKEDQRDYEAEASAMGWKPKEEFKGDPEKWGTAKEFVERGEANIPMLVANQRKLTEKLARMEESISYQADMHVQDLQQQADQMRAAHEKEMENAVADGDTQAYQEARDRRDKVKDPVSPAVQQGPSDIEVQFAAENSWYNTDPVMTQVANAESQRLGQSGINGAANLEAVKAHVMKNFPHKFANPKRDDPSAVSTGRTPAKPNGKGFSNLPEDAKQAFEGFFKDGIYGRDVKKADAQVKYASTYQWDK